MPSSSRRWVSDLISDDMKNMKASRRFLPAGMLCVWLLLPPLAPAALTSCQQDPASINITMVSDYSQILEALGRTNQSLTEKLSLVETALSQGFADSKEAGKMLSQALSTLPGTMEEKLAQIEAAVKSQTASLEIKLALIEAAVTGGFTDIAAQQALILSALQSLAGTMEERLAAIETAIKSQTASLEARLALIETAVKEGLADETAELELLQQAVYALIGTASERLQAIEKAVASQSTSLSAALALVELALDNRLADVNKAMDLLLQAVNKLDGTMDQKLGAIEAAVRSQTSGFETKLDLIAAAVEAGFADELAQQQLLKTALESLDGTLEENLAQIEAAVNSQTTNLSLKLEIIAQTVENGMTADKNSKDLIVQAVESLAGTLEQRLDEINQAVCSQTLALWAKLVLIETTLNKGLGDEVVALGQIGQALSSSLEDGVDSIMTALNQVNTTLQGQVTAVLANIVEALKGPASGPLDYSPILLAIQQTLKEISGENMLNGHEYVVMGPNGLKWATCNVGADNPWDYGDYFAWGETEPYYSSLDPLGWKTGKEDGYAAASYGKTITDITLQEQDDAARQNWGGTWRMPTIDELIWLRDHSLRKWTDNYNGTGVRGVILTSTVETYIGNQIFLPVTGYWNGTQWHELGTYGYCLYFWSSTAEDAFSKALMMEGNTNSLSCSTGNKLRYYGLSVRPVSD